MTNALAIWLTIWFAVVLLYVAKHMNDVRVIFNNLLPEAGYSDFMKPGSYRRLTFSFGRMDPAKLNETGRLRLKQAILNERIFFWGNIAMFILTVCAFEYFRT